MGRSCSTCRPTINNRQRNSSSGAVSLGTRTGQPLPQTEDGDQRSQLFNLTPGCKPSTEKVRPVAPLRTGLLLENRDLRSRAPPPPPRGGRNFVAAPPATGPSPKKNLAPRSLSARQRNLVQTRTLRLNDFATLGAARGGLRELASSRPGCPYAGRARPKGVLLAWRARKPQPCGPSTPPSPEGAYSTTKRSSRTISMPLTASSWRTILSAQP